MLCVLPAAVPCGEDGPGVERAVLRPAFEGCAGAVLHALANARLKGSAPGPAYCEATKCNPMQPCNPCLEGKVRLMCEWDVAQRRARRGERWESKLSQGGHQENW